MATSRAGWGWSIRRSTIAAKRASRSTCEARAAKPSSRSWCRSLDMLLQNFSPDVMDAMGLGYAVLKELNPGIIMFNVSGFGQYGPYRDRRAFDPIGQAMAG